MNFKIIGLRILEGCNSRFQKNLKENIFYNFLNEYEFNLDCENEIESILYTPTIPDNFYTFNNKNYNGQINISAIVGSNGSGKSNLLELFIASILIISYKLRSDFLDLDKFAEENNIDINDLKSDFDDLEKINIEIIYKSSFEGSSIDSIYKITLKDKKLIQTEYLKNTFESNFYSKKSENEIHINHESSNIIYDLFYNNYINYSLHSLNPKDNGLWIETIFHKNDNYQLPIVINPYRNNGIIDINNENYLNLTRFIVNTIQYKDLRKVNDKKINSIIITLNEEKIYKSKNKVSYLSQDLKIEIIKILLSGLDKELPNHTVILNDKLALFTIDYIINKLIRILNNKDYSYYSILLDFENNINTPLFSDFIEKIQIDQSHVTLKFKQALNFLILRQIEEEDLNTDILDLNERILNKINKLFNKISDFYPIIFFLPSFFNFEIKFEDGFCFNKLSSGEKHKLYVIHSILYHIRNIISRKYQNNPYNVPYRNINIILDEVELYMHPEYQRTLISDLIRHINLINLDETNINIIFATHSPFILSDIPSQNVLKLKEGEPNFDSNKLNSLGANIHDMLADEFFLNSGSKGGYIDGLINDFLIFYHETLLNIVKKDLEKISYDNNIEKKINFYNSVFQNIGDEVIQRILLNNINALTEQLNEIKDV
ncbi:AAA family ATPase [Empedobacter falsenii]|uniref:AAA family ATPase n=1 Tax=Empedobacter falsenii TaxID=343874 RepID=UPI003A7FA8B9